MQSLTPDKYPAEPVVIDTLSVKFMKASKFVPIALDNGTLKIAMARPEDFWTVD
ncbi:MAG: type II secretion system protein GspE, partial [Desulfobacterales bacterium]